MEIFWGALGVIAWVGWSFTRNRPWQKPILYWFVLVQICLITAILMVKSSQASEQPSAFVDYAEQNKRHLYNDARQRIAKFKITGANHQA